MDGKQADPMAAAFPSTHAGATDVGITLRGWLEVLLDVRLS
jgi:hypothetical protein